MLLPLYFLIVFCPVISVSQQYNRGALLPFEYREGQRFIFFPDGNDSLHIIDLHEKLPGEKWKFDPTRDVVLNLFTSFFRRRNSRAPNIINSEDMRNSVESYSINITKPIKFIIHGWRSGLFGKIHTILTTDILKTLDVNVIFVDWNFVAERNYLLAVSVVPEVGKYVASVVDSLVELGVPLENIHLIGHSLGAHIAGIAGRMIKSGKLTYITGFDPALPLWHEKTARIRPSDAEYVEIIHTNAGILGIKDPVGHADFYPNGGTNQPGCTFDIACAHSRSYLYYADSLDHNLFRAAECTSLDEVYSKTCANISQTYMGGSKPKNSRGLFYLVTNKERPFYLGQTTNNKKG